jgi:Ca-activated chloride channel family protein
MKNFKKFSLGIAMLISFLTFGQDPSASELAKQKTITGIVSDQSGPLPGANVVVKGTTRSTQTNFDGKYSITGKIGEVLVFSFTGYNTSQVTIGNSNVINITLTGSVNLSEVVIEGYRSTPKRKSSVAQTTVISGKTITNQSNKGYLQSIQGQVPGLQISHASGNPGGTKVSIRGVSSLNTNTKPLYIVDGVPVKEEDFKSINPNDINTVNVLKDSAAASLYGNRANNGAIVVQTKTGVQQNLSDKELKKRIKEIDKNTTPIVIEPNNEDYDSFVENPFESPTSAPLSTFSIDVDNASYTNVRRFINNGQTVPKDAVRVEEMVNFFKYQYPQPTGEHPFSINTEYSECPWNIQNKLVYKVKIFQPIICQLPIWFF